MSRSKKSFNTASVSPTDALRSNVKKPLRGIRRFLFIMALTLVVIAAMALLYTRQQHAPTATGTEPLPRTLAYVGSSACTSCHADQAKAWQGSQHAIALQTATPETVFGTIDNRTHRFGKSATRFSQHEQEISVSTEGADGKPFTAPITHVIGVAPLQQYLVSLPDGRKQSLGVSWDSRPKADGGQRWFHLFAKEGTQPGHPMHWSGIDQNWNYQCADCHSTNLRKNYSAATNRFNTTWSEISVGCEACHGPGQAHIDWANQSPRRALANYGLTAALDERRQITWKSTDTGTAIRSAPRTSAREIEVCARCHSRRGQFGDDHRAGDPLLDNFRPALLEPGLYYPDGQQRDEVYNYASFLQSRMHAAGVSCSDCHEPHSGKLRAPGNAVCVQCHDPARFDATTHHHHPAATPSAACVGCHAPTTIYMGVDARHDHSFRIPRPDRSDTLGVPNACTQCHAGKPASWASAAIRSWYPSPRPGFQGFAEIFAAIEAESPTASDAAVRLINAATEPVIVRASALGAMSRHPELLSPAMFNAAFSALDDSDGLVRSAAIQVAQHAPPASKGYHLVPLLDNRLRLVRMDAARALANVAQNELKPAAKAAFDKAIQEYIAAQEFNADRPEAQANLGGLYSDLGLIEDARQAFERAIERDKGFAAGWLGLSQVLEKENKAKALETLRAGRHQIPESAELAHAEGLLLIRQQQKKEALPALETAHRLAPPNARFHYVYAVALHDLGHKEQALTELKALAKRHPNYREARQTLAAYSAGADG